MVALFGFYSFIALLLVQRVKGQSTTQVCSTSRPCRNGGVCEKHLDSGGNTIQLCNCGNTDRDGTRYSGLYCEKKSTEGGADSIKNNDASENDSNDNNDSISNDNDTSNNVFDDTDIINNSICPICLNGGTCINNKCRCRNGFRGLNCESTSEKNSNDDDELDDDDVLNDSDFSDDKVSDDIDDHAGSICPDGSHCLNGGHCEYMYNLCICRDGFEGRICESRTGKNSYNNKNSNNEYDNSGNVSSDDTSGVQSEGSDDTSSSFACVRSSSCYNGGSCVKNQCICRDGFTGRYCFETTISSRGVSVSNDDNNFDNNISDRDTDDKKNRAFGVAGFALSFVIIGLGAVFIVVSYTRSKKERLYDNKSLKRQKIVQALTTKENTSSRLFTITDEEIREVADLI